MNEAFGVLRELGADLDFEALEGYAVELERWNRSIRLVGPKDLEGVRVQIADALLPFLHVVPAFPLLDIGSGAGLPGLAIAAGLRKRWEGGSTQIVCMEPQGKRVSFLRHGIRHLGLKGVEVVGERAEDALGKRPELGGYFLTVTARAVSEPGVLLSLAAPFLAVGGRTILPRGAELPINAEGWRLTMERSYEGPAGVGARTVHVYARAGES